jgi:DNA-binding transcriptional LysR family regulator
MNPRITLDQWRALVAVVDAGGYAQAAAALSKSQSSITYAVQQIESLLGVDVFETRGRRAVPTPTGDLLVRRARYLVDEAAGLEASAQRLSAGWEAEIRLAVEIIFPTWLLDACMDRFGRESPHTRMEVMEVVLGHRMHALESGEAHPPILGSVPSGFTGAHLMRLRFLPVAHPDHPLHALGHPLTTRDLRAHRHLVVRETSVDRGGAPSLESTQRWTFTQMASSIEAARNGHGFAWLPEEKIRQELATGTLAPLTLRDGSERFADLYLVFADAEHAGPGTQRLAALLREGVADECRTHHAATAGAV